MAETIKLSAPIKAHGETLHALELREPTGEDIAAVGGFPFTIGEGGAMSADGPKLVGYVSRLAAIPLSSARAIAGRDWMVIFGVLSGFFAPTADAGDLPMPSAARKITAKAN